MTNDNTKMRNVILQVLSTFKSDIFSMKKFRLALLESGISSLKLHDQIDQFFSKHAYSALNSNTNGNLYIEEFRLMLQQLGIADRWISDLIKHLDPNKVGSLTEARGLLN